MADVAADARHPRACELSRARRDVRVNCGPQSWRFCRAKGPAATAARDTAFFERTLTKEYARFGGGMPANVAAQFAEMKAGAVQIESLTIRDLRAQVFGDGAIVSMETHRKGTYKGKPISEQLRGVDLFARLDGRRQVFNGPMTTIKG